MIDVNIETNFIVSLDECAFGVLVFEAIGSIDESPFFSFDFSNIHINLHVLRILLDSESISVKLEISSDYFYNKYIVSNIF